MLLKVKEKRKYHHKGYFAKLIKKITDELNLPIVIVDPMERMQEIGIKQGWIEARCVNSLIVLPNAYKSVVDELCGLKFYS